MKNNLSPFFVYRNWSILLLFALTMLVACSIDEMVAEPVTQDISDNRIAWTPSELARIRSLWLEMLPPLPSDPSNAIANDPQAVDFGHRLFFDKRLSGNGEFSCATCHQPELMFTDGLVLAEAMSITLRNTPTIVGLGHSEWFYWDGRRDSMWSQALTPLEALTEQGGTRTQFIHIISEDEVYRAAYEAIFGPLPDFSDRSRFPDSAGPFGDGPAQDAWSGMALDDRELVNQVFANMGKSIAAYERLILPGQARFDQYAEALFTGSNQATSILTEDEIAGLRLFLGQAQCIRCHNSPLFTNRSFHNINVSSDAGLPIDFGRTQGISQVSENLFNCLGPYSDAEPDQCTELRFMKTSGEEILGAFKVPTLRNVAETAPYMHAGQFDTLNAVLNHYNVADAGAPGHSEIHPLNLSEQELAQIEAFLRTLSAPLNVEPKFLAPPE